MGPDGPGSSDPPYGEVSDGSVQSVWRTIPFALLDALGLGEEWTRRAGVAQQTRGEALAVIRSKGNQQGWAQTVTEVLVRE